MNIALDATKVILATLELDRPFVEEDKWKMAGDGYERVIEV